MEPDPGAPTEIRLPFEPGDRFIQVHANGAILVVADDYQWNLATVGQAVAVATEAVADGTRIILGHEVLDEPTTAVLEAIRGTGATIVDFATVIPPMTWPQGTTPLMTAATQHRNDLIEDLLARGFSPDERDELGGTALHHAAQVGNRDGCDLLVAAGIDLGTTDAHGRTPSVLARAGGHHALAARLEPEPVRATAAGVDAGGDVRFGWGAPATFVYYTIGMGAAAVLFGVGAATSDGAWRLVLAALAAGVVWLLRDLVWAGGPLRVRDGRLELLTLRGIVRVPLEEVRGVMATPARGINGIPWKLVLCQDHVGPRSRPRRLRAVDAVVGADEAERFAAVAERHQVAVLGRGRSVIDVGAAVAPHLRRPGVVTNTWWAELLARVGDPGGETTAPR